jgi:multidrug efflux pump subunit AcrA (membrane-fusion protein)
VTFEIEVNGRMRRVSVERCVPGHYRVILDGAAHEVGAVRVGEYGLSLLLDDGMGTSHEIQIAPGVGPGEWLAGLDGRTASVSVNGWRRRRSADRVSQADGEQTIVAPMSGRVVRILAAPGDQVDARQPVIVVEAMKMENELRSPKAGRVTRVAVTPGMSVDGGQALVVIE